MADQVQHDVPASTAALWIADKVTVMTADPHAHDPDRPASAPDPAAVAELIRSSPRLVVDLLAAVGVQVPDHTAVEVIPAEEFDLGPVGCGADAVLIRRAPEATAAQAVVMVAPGPEDRDRRRWSWPSFVANTSYLLQCPTAMLAICADEDVAALSAETIDLGPGFQFTPLVLGPVELPGISDSEPYQVLHAVLDALADAGSEMVPFDGDPAVRPAAAVELDRCMTPDANWLPGDPRVLIPTELARGDFLTGDPAAVLTFLDRVGIEVPADARTRINRGAGTDRFDIWIRRTPRPNPA